jgi:raffinose/stachyose/melibiose transport system substrate-binding protein
VSRLVRASLVIGLLAAASAAIATAATAKSARPSASPSGTVTLSMATTYKPGFDVLIPNFNRIFPNITIKPSYYVSGAPYTTAVTTQFSAGNGTDLVWATGARTGPTATWPFAQAGYLTDLSGRPWVKRMYAADKAQYVFNKKVYTYDFGLSILALPAYNKEFFAQNKLKVPTTFAQLLTLCKTISGMGKIPIAWAGGSAAVNTNNVVALAGSTVTGPDPGWLQKRLNHKTTFAATPGWRRAVQMLADMKSASCFGPGVEAVQIPQMLQQFASGQAAMMFTYAGLNAQVVGINPNLKIGLFPPPADNPKNTTVTVQAAGGIALNAKSPNKQAALTFLDFLGREKQQRLFAKINYLVSPFDAQKGKLPGIYADVKPWFSANKVVSTITAEWPNTSMGTNVGTSIQGLFTGQKNVNDILADMDKFFESTS